MTRAQFAPRTGRVEGGDGLQLYHRMRLIRRFEDEVHQPPKGTSTARPTSTPARRRPVGVCSVLGPGTGSPPRTAGTARRSPWASRRRS